MDDVRSQIYDDICLGEEQVSSNECWDLEEEAAPTDQVYPDLHLGEEKVSSNECYNPEEE